MMSRFSTSSVRPAIGVATLSFGVVALAGCLSSEVAPDEKRVINLSGKERIGTVEISNLLLVSRGEGEPARLIGVLLNKSESSVEVVFSDADDEATVALNPGQQYAFHENPTIFGTAGETPGGYVDVTVTLGDESDTMTIPVRNGKLG